jgi:nucleolar protein 58
MVATKAALSIRVDALTDVEGKSDPLAPSIGLENRAKLEYRLHKLEEEGDQSGVRKFADNSKKQKRFEPQGDLKVYNTAADAVDLVPSQREPQKAAASDTKEDKKQAKKKIKEVAMDVDETTDETSTLDLENEQKDSKAEKEKKRKRRESEPTAGDTESKVC